MRALATPPEVLSTITQVQIGGPIPALFAPVAMHAPIDETVLKVASEAV